MPNPRERAMRALVDQYAIHGALHALVEVCYRVAAELPEEPCYRRPTSLSRKYENWRKLARELSNLEAMAAHLDL